MGAVYTALSRWEPRITLSTVNITSAFDGTMVVELTGQRNDGSPVALSVPTQQRETVAVIDLSQLPAPEIIEVPDSDALLDAHKTALIALYPSDE